MAYLKPQSPIKNGEDYIYPLTTYDQVILENGNRWDGKSDSNHDHEAADITSGKLSDDRLPFKYDYGAVDAVTTSGSLTVNFNKTFSSRPMVFVNYAKTGDNVSGDLGALKVANITNTSFALAVGGSASGSWSVNWFAIGA